MRVSLAIAAILIMSGTAATAGEREKKPNRNGLICVDQKQTGSRLGKQRVCMTKAQWEQSRRFTQDEINERQIRHINPQG